MHFLKQTLVLFGVVLIAACKSGGGGSSKEPAETTLTVNTQQLSVSASTDQLSQPSASISLSVSSAPDSGLFIRYQFSNSGISDVNFYSQESNGQLDVYYKTPASLSVGNYNDIISLSICHDEACNKQVKGSPVSISSTYQVTAGNTTPTDPDSSLPAVPFTHTAPLPHDVIDAEFSRNLNAVIMVSSYPANRLYRYDVQTGLEYFVALPKTATSVSVSPDGHFAAIGHDALISYVSLDQLTSSSATATPLNISVDVLDVILAGNGYVYAMPRRDQWAEIRSVHIANNVETGSGYPSIYAGTLAKLHPSGEYMYGANNGLSPSDIEKYDIRSGTAKVMYDSPYHGDYSMCGDLWFNTSGSRIYTACGNTFRSSADQSRDMTYTGALSLSDSMYYGYRIVSLSDNEATNSVALIESPWYECSIGSDPNACRSYLRLHENEYLNFQTKYKFNKVMLSGNSYRQDGKFVFHSSNDNRVIVITKLHAMPNPDTEFYINLM